MKLAKKLIVSLLLITVIVSMLPLSASASGTVAWGAANVTGSSVRIRSGPGLEHSVLTHASRGDVVVVIERSGTDWHKVNFHGHIGYINTDFLENHRVAANFNARGSVSGSVVNMRERPNTTSNVLGSHSNGTVMNIIGINDGWYKVEHGSHTGYIRSDLMSVLARDSASSSGSRNTQNHTAPDANLPLGQQIAQYASGYVGYNYVWGGDSPEKGFDCSGLVTYVMKKFGIKVTRTASGQYRDNGVHINKSDLVPGDLVFFSTNGRTVTHVGIYTGDNKFVHASGTRVGVITSNLNSNYYTRVWFGAKRVI